MATSTMKAAILHRADDLRVYPPDATASKVVPFPFGACARVGPAYLNVEAVTSH